MTSHRTTFDTYKVIFPCNVHLSDDSVVEAIRMDSIIMGVKHKVN